MKKINSLNDVIGFLENVAEYELAKPKRIPIDDGSITVASKNYQAMQEVIEWVQNECKLPKKVYLVYVENFNGSLHLKNACARLELAKKYEAEYDKKTFAYIEAVDLEESK